MVRWIALLLTVLTGFSGLVYEVAWQKYVATLLGSHSEATAAVLALFLGGLSLGYALFGRLTRGIVARGGRAGRLLLAYGVVETAIGGYAFSFPTLFSLLRELSYALPEMTSGVGFGIDVLLVALLLLPPTVLMGGTIPILTQALSTHTGDATRVHALVYASNTFGAFAGALTGGFVLLPAMTLFICALFSLMPLIDPRGENIRRSEPAVLTVWSGVIWVLAAAQALITLTALERIESAQTPGPFIGFACAMLLVVLGNVLSKTRPNWLIGIRTPWTLSSDKSWDVTHRWGGRLMMGGGAISAVSFLLTPPTVAFTVLGVTVTTLAGVSVGLSYWVWKNDPDRDTYSAASD